jgi:flagellar FliL protein
VECLIALLFIPSAQTVTAQAQAHDVPHAHELPADPIEALHSHDDHGATVEMDLENFTVTAYQPSSGTTLRIMFHLYAAVAEEEEQDFHHLLEEHKHRIREQVIVILRSSEIADLTDAGLGLIKRKLLDKINKSLGKPIVKSVIVSDFTFIEQ